jgi:hypothetical protein
LTVLICVRPARFCSWKQATLCPTTAWLSVQGSTSAGMRPLSTPPGGSALRGTDMCRVEAKMGTDDCACRSFWGSLTTEWGDPTRATERFARLFSRTHVLCYNQAHGACGKPIPRTRRSALCVLETLACGCVSSGGIAAACGQPLQASVTP